MFLREGLPIVPANNDRINGWRMLKQWLHWTPTRNPKLRIMEDCTYLIQTTPTLKYTNAVRTDIRREDLDTRMADDAVDALRYAVISAFGYPSIEGLDGLSPDLQYIVEQESSYKLMYKPKTPFDENAVLEHSFKSSMKKSYYAQY
jgi:hypothetical protein